jgi:Leucine-rich repeat (LRR) protein
MSIECLCAGNRREGAELRSSLHFTSLTDCFPFSRKLKRLNLGGNELQSVPTSALSSFDMLKKLEIQENLISEISEGDFQGTCRMELNCDCHTSACFLTVLTN